MATKTEMLDQRAAALKSARDIVDGATAAGRANLTPTEQTTVEAKMTEVKALDAQIKGRNLVQSVRALGTTEDDPDASGHRPGVFTEADSKGLVTAVKTRTSYRCEVPSKAVIGAVGLLPTVGTGVVPGLHPGGMFALASLFANEPASGPSVRYYALDGATAAVVAEGAVKPDAGLAVTPKDALLVKLATVSTVSDELAEDAPQMVAYISQELQAAVTVAENDHIVSSLTTSGILTDSATGAELLDAFADQIAAQTASTGYTPSAIVVAPSVLSTLRKARGTSNDAYTFDPMSAEPAMVHGVPLVVTASTPADTAWVIGGRAATMFRRGPITVDVGLSADDWVRNQTHLRCEERVVLAVQRAGMISKITVTA